MPKHTILFHSSLHVFMGDILSLQNYLPTWKIPTDLKSQALPPLTSPAHLSCPAPKSCPGALGSCLLPCRYSFSHKPLSLNLSELLQDGSGSFSCFSQSLAQSC